MIDFKEIPKANKAGGSQDRFEQAFYSGNHPIIVTFGVNRAGGSGKAEKICTLGEVD